MHKTIYTSEVKDDRLDLELSWSQQGIHLDISQEDRTYLASLIFTSYDIRTMIDELEIYADALDESNNPTKPKRETSFPSEQTI